MCDQLVQVRGFEVVNQRIIDYSILAGDCFAFEFNERAWNYLDLEVAPRLSNGRYIMVFTPVDLNSGSDAIEDIEIYRLIGTAKHVSK